MANTSSSHARLSLDEEWLARTLEGIDVGEVQRQALAYADDRRLCLTVVAADGSPDAWARYSEAATRRATASGDRLCPLVASGHMERCFFVAYDIGAAEPLYPDGALAAVSNARCVRLLHGVGRGLDEAAAAGFYPTELTPESVFVDRSRGALLADLGVAREGLGSPPGEYDARAPWVAPEVLQGDEADDRSAVYSFGALMYTLLTGAPPYDGTADEIVDADPPSIRSVRPDLPDALEVVISTAMARDPRRRYRNAAETRSLANILLQGDLVSEAAMQGEDAAPATTPRRRAAALRRRSAETVAAPKSDGGVTAAGAGAPAAPASETARPRDGKQPRKAAAGARAAVDAKAPSEPATAQPAGATLDDTEREAARAPRARTTPRKALPGVALALAAGALAAGALAGVLLSGPGAEEPPAPHTFSRGGLEVRLPGDWRGSSPGAGALAAHPVGDPGSGLTLELVDAPVERKEQGNPVRLGRLEAWREPAADVPGARAAVRYVVPTESGKLVATCRASARAARGTLSTCERVASTLSLRSATELPIAAVVEQQERWSAEVTRLGEERSRARLRLARAERPAGQRLAAEALARVHDRAAGRFAALPGGEAVADAARRTAGAYRSLAGAADGESSRRWNAARARVQRSEAALRRALAGS